MIEISIKKLLEISKLFRQEMALSDYSSLKMINSHLRCPSGFESGHYIAIDFGGTNIRIAIVSICKGVFDVLDTIKFGLSEYGFDYSSGVATADELFSLIATKIHDLGISLTETILLGHTFSFPCRQVSANKAILLHWTKEIDIAGCVGEDINQILKDTLRRHGLSNVSPVAILNDTIATLLSASYTNKDVSIGSICGTGHNSAYFDSSIGCAINIEAGNFDKIPVSFIDTILDTESRNPGHQRLEKMTSGRYLGELYRIGVEGLFSETHAPYSISSIDVEKIINSQDSARAEFAKSLVKRSAGLVAASYHAILNKIDSAFTRNHVISVDGSLYTEFDYFRAELHTALNTLLGDYAQNVSIKNFGDGSLTGAAVAAALVSQE